MTIDCRFELISISRVAQCFLCTLINGCCMKVNLSTNKKLFNVSYTHMAIIRV